MISLVEHNFKISNENIDEVCSRINQLCESKNVDWLSCKKISQIKVDELENEYIDIIYIGIRIYMEKDKNFWKLVDIKVNKKGNEKELFNLLLPYMDRDSYVKFRVSNGKVYKYKFNKKIKDCEK